MTFSAELLGGEAVRLRLASVPKKLRPALKREFTNLASATIVPEMRRRAGDYSSRIPKSITVSTRFGFSTAGVFIRQSTRVAPHGPINEGGGRHPVFARRGTPREQWTWAYQPPRPFFFISARGKTNELRAAGQRAINEALR